jgi:hypothetical protein
MYCYYSFAKFPQQPSVHLLGLSRRGTTLVALAGRATTGLIREMSR